MHYSQRTTLQFPYVVLSERSFDSSTGQEEKASVERRAVAGHLQDTVGIRNERVGENNKRFILFISFNTW
jgi:hypothetical protein